MNGADYKEKKYCHSLEDVEKFGTPGDQYAIIEFTSVYIPGDERSRTNPGHGYPAHNEDVCQFTTFETKDAWEREILHRLEQDRKYSSSRGWFPFVFRRPKITTQISIAVEE
jgi:hypothetical protein